LDYKKEIQGKSYYGTFKDERDLKDQINKHLTVVLRSLLLKADDVDNIKTIDPEEITIDSNDQSSHEIETFGISARPDNPSTFIKKGRPIISYGDASSDLFAPDEKCLYLRISPINVLKLENEAEVLNIINESNLMPFAYQGNEERRVINEHGAIAYINVNRRICSYTQVFKTGEIWGCADYEMFRLYDNSIRLMAIDKLLFEGITDYLKFAKEALLLSSPVLLRIGFQDIKNYTLTIPFHIRKSYVAETSKGHLFENNFLFQCLIKEYTMTSDEILNSFYKDLLKTANIPKPDEKDTLEILSTRSLKR